MRKFVVSTSLTLDGVMQARAGPTRTGAAGSSTAAGRSPYNDEVMMQAMGEGMAQGAAAAVRAADLRGLLRRLAGAHGQPVHRRCSTTRRSTWPRRTLREPLPWQNSTLLAGDAAETVARLKKQPGNDLAVLGSGELVQTLMRHGLVDEYVLLIHPLVLGGAGGCSTTTRRARALRLVDSVPTTTGVMIATYRAEP